MKMSFIEKQELILEICKGFELMISTVERIEKLAEEAQAGEKSETTVKFLTALMVKSLEMVVKKVNKLLEKAYALEDAEFMEELKVNTDMVTAGKEHLLIVALMLGEEN